MIELVDPLPTLDETIQVWAWRLSVFVDLGYDYDRADELARTNIDHHELAALIRRGCPPATAARILT